MALKVSIQTSKTVSKWREYVDKEGNVLAEFKIRGISYKPYQVALERANNQITSKGYDVSKASKEDKLYHELLLEAAACHLIEDWKGVIFEEENAEKEIVETEPEYSPENAIKLLNMGDIGVAVWLYIRQEAENIQNEADFYKDEVVGKSSSSTTGPSSAQKKKRTTTARNKRQSPKP
ncbi:hypothetical protein SAMN02799632_02036 [Acinetobacter pittii]|uniref:hypothetical protein n=1 Tax=Acinetobacter calcoaceticus/baumannii complex TaxID=909768 RepID=UPI0007073F54|nr:hypothetical protein [Acinetobacter pittii]KQE15680.1 hypothetical protein APD38_16155 [Acinetobacter pittii]KQE27270.1 hypothetical protein APD39_17485 [Acinetobacter pittii]MCU4512290.1 hypothetical protein [Acinetobacter pittii]OCY84246.1 hypothetical protein BFR90_18815 [Acinetobacter pittii]OCZ28952.1 hypothetical protein BFR68_12195 [Acinetobacter pittii]